MPRNFFRRIELMFPIEDPRLKTRIVDEILRTLLTDNVKARQLHPDGSYAHLAPANGEAPVRSQVVFQSLARGSARESGEHPLQFLSLVESKDGAMNAARDAAAQGLVPLPRKKARRVRIARPRDSAPEPGGAST